MVAMLMLSLMAIAAAVVMLSSFVAAEHVDPMGVFGLPPCARSELMRRA